VGEEDGPLRLLQEMTIVTHGNPGFCPLFAASKRKKSSNLFSVFWSRIRIRRICQFSGLPDPDTYLFLRIRILPQQAKIFFEKP
jgi:hypothetical protein